MALAFLAAGVQAFVLSYSLLPQGWPQQFLEGAAALAWLRAHAGELGIRPDRVAVCGFSAGGHLAAACPACGTTPCWGSGWAWTPEQARPNASILGYPVVNDMRYIAPLGGKRSCGWTGWWGAITRPPSCGLPGRTPRCRCRTPWTTPPL